MASPYDLLGNEKKVLASPPEISGINVSDTLAAIETKVSEAIKNLVRYSVYLDRMDDERYTPAERIKRILGDANNFRPILSSILRTESISKERRLQIAASLLEVSTDFIISQMSEPLRKKAIAKPLEEVKNDLLVIIDEQMKNESWQRTDAFMKRREERVRRMDRIIGIGPVPGNWSAICISCVAGSWARDLNEAICSINHDKDCIYKDDKGSNGPFRQLLLHYKVDKFDAGAGRAPAAPLKTPKRPKSKNAPN